MSRELRVNGELFTLTYGSLVAQLLEDYENHEEVNKQLEKIGYNMGVRMVDDFVAHRNTERCGNFKESCSTLAKDGFRMFLGVGASIGQWNEDETECVISLEENPLIAFVELPSEHSELSYSSVYCGAIKGAMEVIQYKTDVTIQKDPLKGDNTTEIKIKLLEVMEDQPPPEDDE
eukprot:m.26836 g.26836  ORF g.26836 m.26836 type:complete len:175 (+) comp9297_c0_seq3:71-595(+)